MKNLILIIIFLNSAITLSGQVKFEDLKKGQNAMITRGFHDSWLIMNLSHEVVFLSAHSGTNNLYLIDLDELIFINSNKKGLLMADYLVEDNYSNKYQALTNFTKGAMDSPEFSPNGNFVAVRQYVKDTTGRAGEREFNLPWKFSLILINKENKQITTLLEKEVSCFTFLTDSTIVFQEAENDTGWLKVLNINSRSVENYLEVSSVLNGITSDKNFIVIHEKNKISIYDRKENKMNRQIEIPSAMQRISYLNDEYLTLTMGGEPSSLYNISNGKTKTIVGSYDYEPSVSFDKKYIIVVSENFEGGILYKWED